MVEDAVSDTIEHEIGDAGNDRLRPLGNEEILEAVVAERGIFHVDFPDDPHRYARLIHPLDGGKIPQDGLIVAPNEQKAWGMKLLGQRAGPFLDRLLRLTRHLFIGAALVGDPHEHVAIGEGKGDLDERSRRDMKAAVFLET